MHRFFGKRFMSLFVLFVLGTIFLFPMRQIFAQLPTTVTTDATATAIEVKRSTGEVIKSGLVGGLTTGLINLMSYIADTLAYEAAVRVANGGPGDTPLFDGRHPADILTYVGSSVAAGVIQELVDENVDEYGALVGFDYCAPPNLPALQIGIRSAYDPQALGNVCTVNQLKNNWSGFLQNIQSSITDPQARQEAILTTLSDTFDPRVNEFSVSLGLYTDTLLASQVEARYDVLELLSEGRFKPVADFVTQVQTTPASLIRTDFYDGLNKQDETRTLIGNALIANSDALIQVGTHAGYVFTTTLLSEVTRKISEGFFEVDEYSDPFDEFASSTDSGSRAQEKLASLLAFRPLEVTNFSLLADFSSCPSTVRGTSRRLYNCVINSSFATAVNRATTGVSLTLQEAVDEGLVDENWPLIPSSDTARDQDVDCHSYGFCHSNLVKLRKARIISVGWELAAESPYNSAEDPVTLGEVMAGFNDCNVDGEIDPQHPWCHLIDPNWVLKYPETQCRTMAYGQILEATGVDSRAQECVDFTSCIDENDDGTCSGGFGYCVREENTWQFRGDACPEYYASCLTFDGSEETIDVLTTTVDQGDCDAGNAGCYWYASQKDEVDGEFDWPEINNTTVAANVTSASNRRDYFTSAVSACDSSDAGCSELYEKTSDLRLNIIQNPTFETDNNEDGIPDGWLLNDAFGNATISTDGSESFSGSVAVSGSLTQYGLQLGQSQFYNLSAYIASSKDIHLLLETDSGDSVDLTGTSFSDSCSQVLGANTIGISASGTSDYQRYDCSFTVPALADPSDLIFARLVFTGGGYIDDIQLEQGEDASRFHAGYSTALSSLVPTYVQLPPTYLGCQGLDSDPEECADYAGLCSEQDAGCSLYSPTNGDPDIAGVASELDICDEECAGYDTYKQESTRYEPDGVFPVYFIPSTADSCSEENVGCDEFTNLSTEEREYFTYLRGCTKEDQAGSDSATFFTWEGSDVDGFQLRTWQLIESNVSGAAYSSATYASGFAETNLGSAPCTNWVAVEGGVSCDDDANSDGQIDSVTESCDEHDDIFSNPDCREFYDADGNIHYREWKETVTVNNSCTLYRKTEIVGLGDDEDGDGSDDGEENCITSGGLFDSGSNTCLYNGLEEESNLCDASANGCRKYTGGQSRNSRLAFEELFEAGTLSNWETNDAANVTLSNESIATGGHSVKLEAGADLWTHIYDYGTACDVEDGCVSPTGTLGASCTVVNGEQYCGTLQNELFPSKVYTVSFWAKGIGDIEAFFELDMGDIGAPSFPITQEEGETIGATLTTEWQRYSFGPFQINEDDYPGFGDSTNLIFVTDDEVYLDNIVIREGESDITVIKDSWSTPATCDENPEGQTVPQYQLGCQEYIDQTGETVYLKSFSKLCDEEKVGCDAFYQTQQSSSEYGKMYNGICESLEDADGDGVADTVTSSTDCYIENEGAIYDTASLFLCTIAPGNDSCQFDLDFNLSLARLSEGQFSHLDFGPDTQRVQQDQVIYAVVDSSVTCNAASAGCYEYGKPTFSADRSIVDSWETVYLLNNPNDYESILCQNDELFCEEWDAGTEGVWYFKHPQGQQCEYKTGVTIDGTQYNGWFRQGTTEFCYGTGVCSEDSTVTCSLDSDCASAGLGECQITDGTYISGGTDSGLWRNGDTSYDGWVGACQAAWDGCSEFEDPVDVGENEVYGLTDGEKYFFIDNDNLDNNTLTSSQSCNGQVSQKQGCVPFYDTGELSTNFNSSASYIASTHADELFGEQPFDLVDPISCDSGDSTITLQNGDTVDLCQRRCLYKNRFLDADFVLGDAEDVFDLYTIGGSCFVDEDCPGIVGDSGDIVDASCKGVMEGNSALGIDGAATPRLEDDTNRILKVNLDRQCSEWLACNNERTIWDSSINAYRTVCSDIDLCQQYSGDGGSSFCTKWDGDDPAVVLDQNRYAERDVSWYGEEYSGYAIPDLFPVQHLSQLNIAPPTVCSDTGVSCESNSDCASNSCISNTEDDWRLAYNAGSCDESYGEACEVGYCSGSGIACSDDAQCEPDGGSCVVGTCYEGVGENIGECSQDDDCSGDEICLTGSCVIDTGTCDFSRSCGSGSTCIVAADYKVGGCYRDTCVVAANGGGADDIVTGEEQICRAYPEANSPFENDVVEEWVQLNTSGEIEGPSESLTSTVGADVYNAVSGYEAAQFCMPGEVCSCSYKKVSSSSSSATPIYIDSETRLDELVDGAAGSVGICSGGPLPGVLCALDLDVADPTLPDSPCGEGTCEPISREDTVFGLEGFCLERDTGININGNADQGACITWLPVDELQGSTDLYAKYTGAGYDLGETSYCEFIQPYADIWASTVEAPSDENWSDANIGCIERDLSLSGDAFDKCINSEANFICPPGQVAFVSDYDRTGDGSDHFAQACKESFDDDCPFVCIPKAAENDAGINCVERLIDIGQYDTGRQRQGVKTITWEDVKGNEISEEMDVYWWDDPNEFTEDVLDGTLDISTCIARGIDIAPDFASNHTISPAISGYDDINYNDRYSAFLDNESISRDGFDEASGDKVGWYNYEQRAEHYIGCKESVVVDDGDFLNAAYTDRLLNPVNNYSLQEVDGTFSQMAYDGDTTRYPYGISLNDDEVMSIDDRTPAVIASCFHEENIGVENYIAGMNGIEHVPPSDNSGGVGNACASWEEIAPLETIDSRAFAYFDFELYDGELNSQSGHVFNWVVENIWTGGNNAGYESARIISQLFATAYRVFEFYDGIGDDESTSDLDFDIKGWIYDATASVGTAQKWDDRADEGNPPSIWALDLNGCFNGYCREGEENAMTVNGKNSGDIESGDGYLRADVNFFAAADKNQLPIRRIIVDWGDGSTTGSDSPDNYFKNHRGLESDSQSASICERCTSSDADLQSQCEWGMTADSCDPNYLSYTHTYVCSAEYAEDLEACNASGTNTPCRDTGGACVYQVGVHVRDNWGWCSGTCNGDSCYDGDGDIEAISGSDQCDYPRYPDDNPSIDPWVYYDGFIRVTPE